MVDYVLVLLSLTTYANDKERLFKSIWYLTYF